MNDVAANEGDPAAPTPELPPAARESLASVALPAKKVAYAGESYGHMVWRLFWRAKLNRVALGIIGLLFVVALFADFLASEKPIYADVGGETYLFPNVFDPAGLRVYNNQLLLANLGPTDSAVLPMVPYGYNTHDLDHVAEPPSDLHWLGTDERGRDVLSRIIHGTRVSLLVAFGTVVVLTLIGITLGSLGGWFGGLTDGGVSRVVETLNSIPHLLVIAIIIGVITPTRWDAVLVLCITLGVLRWTTVTRLIRGEILKIKTLQYVDAARALGASQPRIILRHVIPNAIAPVLVAMTFETANAVLIEGSLSFIGFGVPDDMASWGGIMQGARFNWNLWWLGLFPGIAVFLTVTAFNLAGEGLRDAIDPRLKG
jgi:peptide/nickel transport system permease protein